MNKIIINVPEGIQYLSGWEGFFEALPMNQHLILNKKICGCGATEAYLRTDKRVILASPRKYLLLDKYKQHLKDNLHLFRFQGSEDDYMSGTCTEDELMKSRSSLAHYIANGGTKILVTYDSLRHVKDCINDVHRKDWIVVVDEWQCIFYDSHFKADTELNFCNMLQAFQTVVYLSATPYLEKYLEQISLFKGLTIYELKWPAETVVKPEITAIRKYKSIPTHIAEIIKKYRKGEGEQIQVNGKQVTSREAVLYLNNVSAIIKAIKKNDIKPEEVNVICSATKSNKEKLSKLGKGFKIGNIPGRGEPHKMFTFCTSTVYVGADFYSTTAYTYIFANPQIRSMTIDIAVDLQQILGRQRLIENPFRNMATIFYSTKLSSEEEFYACQRSKEEETQHQIENFQFVKHRESQLMLLENEIRQNGHFKHYCSITQDSDGKQSIVMNELSLAAENRAWEILNKIYKNEFSMCLALQENYVVDKVVDSENKEIQEFYTKWNLARSFSKRAQLYCEFSEDNEELIEVCHFIPSKYKTYYEALGTEGLEALRWREDSIKSVLEPTPFSPIPRDKIAGELVKRLQVSKSYSKAHVKDVLKEIYDSLHLNITPKASDITDYFSCKETSKREFKQKIAMFQILDYYKTNVSLFPLLTKPNDGREYTLDKVLEIIKNNSYFNVKEKTAKVRACANREDMANAKLKLPAVTFNGTFSTKHSTDIITYSSFTALDFDNVSPSRLYEFAQWLKTFECVYAYYKTPSGKGYRAIILHDNLTPDYHYDLYSQLLKKFDCPEIDKSTSDLARGNFLSYDPDLWINPKPIPFHFVPTQIEPLQPKQTYTNVKDSCGGVACKEDSPEVTSFLNKLSKTTISDDSIIRMLNHIWEKKPIVEGERNNRSMSYAGILCKAGVEKDKALRYLEKLIPDYDVAERVDYAYSHNDFCCQRYRYRGKKKAS